MLAEATFQAIDHPVSCNGQRASGLRFADPKVHHLFHALLLFRLLPDGFRSADLRQHPAGLRGCLARALGPGAITYQLRRLRLHGMIERRPPPISRHRSRLAGRSLLHPNLQPPAAAKSRQHPPRTRRQAHPAPPSFRRPRAQHHRFHRRRKLRPSNLTHLHPILLLKRS
jgi:hypothetical protein